MQAVQGFGTVAPISQEIAFDVRLRFPKPTPEPKPDPHGASCGPGAQECSEEAGIPPALAGAAVAAGAVSYTAAQPAGVKRDVLFVYDLRLPPEFVPAPQARASLCLYRWPQAKKLAAWH